MESIGRVFTPIPLARQALALSGFLNNWDSPCRLLDPACGGADLLKAAYTSLPEPGALPSHFTGLDREAIPVPGEKPKQSFTLRQGDFFHLPPQVFSHIFTNPPWVTYQDLPESYKPQAKVFFQRYLKLSPSKLLLGLSRADLAGPYMIKIFQEHCSPGSRILAFLPGSLFFGHGANIPFLQAMHKMDGLRLRGFWDCGTADAFPHVATRAVLAFWEWDKADTPAKGTDRLTAFADLKDHTLGYVQPTTQGWRIIQDRDRRAWDKPKIHCPAPRQGINSCGANQVFFLQKPNWQSPYLFPLYDQQPQLEDQTARDRDKVQHPGRWVVLPHDEQKGKPLPKELIDGALWEYLREYRVKLQERKGVLIQSLIKKGYWWALQGVGPYTFAPYKIVWRALGTTKFNPQLVGPIQGKPVIPHQSLYAYLSFWSKDDAQKILEQLQVRRIEEELLRRQGAGTKNFAQPGRLKAIIDFCPEN
jgi:hypothetical protein